MKQTAVLVLLVALLPAVALAQENVRKDILPIQIDVSASSITASTTFNAAGTVKRMWADIPALTGTATTTSFTLCLMPEQLQVWAVANAAEGAITSFDCATAPIYLSGDVRLKATTSAGQSTSATLTVYVLREGPR